MAKAGERQVATAGGGMARRSQRIALAQPLRATFGAASVTVTEMSDRGATIEHAQPLAIGTRDRMVIQARPTVEVTGVVRHSVIVPAGGGQPPAYRSGIVFHEISETVEASLESILVDEAAAIVRLWQANADGHTSSSAMLELHRRTRVRSTGAYVWMRYVDREWHRITTRDPNQPIDGFSIHDDVDPQQIALLCAAYERGSSDDRNVIRAIAQLVIAEDLGNRPRNG